MRKVPKTTGLDFLAGSLGSFNGSGYGDYESGEAYLDSYIDYQRFRKREGTARQAESFREELLPIAEHLVFEAQDPGRRPNAKKYAEYIAFRKQNKLV